MTIYPLPEEDYATLFRQNVLRSVQALLARTRRETTLGLTEEARTRILTMLDYAFHLGESWPTLGELLRLLAPKFDLTGYRVQWLPYLEKGVAASATYHDPKTEATLTCDMGLIHQRLGRLDTAQMHLERACSLAREQEERPLLALALQRLAEIARLRRRYGECNVLLYEAKALFAPDHLAQAYGLFVAGKAAFDQHDFVAATAAFTQAMEIWQAAGNPGRAALCIQNLGRIASARGEPQLAIPFYEQAIELLTAAKDLGNLAVVQMNLGVAYYQHHQYELALMLSRDAEASLQAMSDDRYLAMVYNNLGLVYTALGEWNEAEANLQRSIGLYQQLGDNKAWISAKGNLGHTYIEQTRYTEAIQLLQEALAELQTTNRDPEYDWLQQELTQHLMLAQEGSG